MPVLKEEIALIRTKFLAEVEKNADNYHQKDVERVKTNDWWIERFQMVTKDEDQALKNLIKTMEWRKTSGVNDFTEEYFPAEIHNKGFASTLPHKDKEGRTVVWIRMSHYDKKDHARLMKNYLIYQFEKADMNSSNQGWATVGEFTDATLSNVDMDMFKYVLEVITEHYPQGSKYIAWVDLPVILKGLANMLLKLMDKEMQNSFKFIDCEELTKYLDRDFFPDYLKEAHVGKH